jgi:hypothetical protein
MKKVSAPAREKTKSLFERVVARASFLDGFMRTRGRETRESTGRLPLIILAGENEKNKRRGGLMLQCLTAVNSTTYNLFAL